MAYYDNLKGEKAAIEHTRTSECPRSMVTPDIEWLNNEFHGNQVTAKNGGALYGPDSGKWPAWFVDTVEVLAGEQRIANGVIGIPDGR